VINRRSNQRIGCSRIDHSVSSSDIYVCTAHNKIISLDCKNNAPSAHDFKVLGSLQAFPALGCLNADGNICAVEFEVRYTSSSHSCSYFAAIGLNFMLKIQSKVFNCLAIISSFQDFTKLIKDISPI